MAPIFMVAASFVCFVRRRSLCSLLASTLPSQSFASPAALLRSYTLLVMSVQLLACIMSRKAAAVAR
jgi:hypothetical protein